jgi:hypothetical protein
MSEETNVTYQVFCCVCRYQHVPPSQCDRLTTNMFSVQVFLNISRVTDTTTLMGDPMVEFREIIYSEPIHDVFYISSYNKFNRGHVGSQGDDRCLELWQ